MPSSYGSGRSKKSSTGSSYGSGRTGSSPKKTSSKKKSGGLGWVLNNLGHEAYDMIVGIPGSGKTIGGAIFSDVKKNPWSLLSPATAPFWAAASEEAKGGNSRLVRDVGKPLVQDYRYRYGPAFSGDFGEFAHRAGERPLSLGLDALAVAAASTKGLSLANVTSKAPRSLSYELPGGAKVEKQIVGSELGRRMRQGTNKVLNVLPKDLAVLGEYQRAAGINRIRNLKDYTRMKLRAAPREAAKRGMKKDEVIAANIMADFPLESDLMRYVEQLKQVEGTEAQVALLTSPKVIRYYENPTSKMLKYIEEENILLGHMEDLLPIDPATAELRKYKPTLLARGAKYEDFDGETELVADRPISDIIDEIKAEISATGRPDARYRPQHSAPEKGGTSPGAGGSAAQRNTIHQNKGILQSMGRVAYNIDTLQPAYMRQIKLATYSDRHADLVRAAKPVDSLPKGYRYVKRNLRERISYTERTKGEFDRSMEEYFDGETDTIGAGPTKRDELTTDKADEAALDENGQRLAVPENFANKIIGEYNNSHQVTKWIWDRPTDVWRAVVLNLRVGWLVNNIVGNTFLYLLKNSGPAGLASYIRHLSPEKRSSLAKFASKDKRLSDRDMAELFPEQTSAGTFMGSQLPTEGLAGAVSKYSPVQHLRKADVYVERRGRAAMAARLAKKNPKVKARLKAMPKETRSLRQAAEKELTPQEIETISKQINDSMGDFFSLSAGERGFVRRLVPFYAWYKAITTIVLKLPIDSPIRTQILANLGRIGQEADEDYGLPWLAGAVPLNDEGKLLGTRAANPMATVPDLGRGIFAGDWFGSRQREGILNPYALIIARALSEEGSLPGRLGVGFKDMGMGLPFSRIAFPQERASYEGDPRVREILSYLGIPMPVVSEEVRNKANG